MDPPYQKVRFSMLKVGFVGLGSISYENVLGYLDSEDAEIVAVCRRDESAARLWLEKWKLPNARYYENLGDMLENEGLDIVEILTPHYLHSPHAVQCAAAGVKGLSLQKPMATSLHECDEIINACERNHVVLKVYENFVFYPVYLKAKELVEQGMIGELISIRVSTRTGLREGAPWPWCWTPGSWSMDLERSGVGPLVGDDGFHKFSLVRWFMSREIERINAWIDPETPLDAPAMIRAKLKRLQGDGPKYAQIDFSFSPHMALPCDFWFEDFVEIVGERGIMWINQCSAAGNRKMFEGCEMSSSAVFPPIAVFVDGRVSTYLEDITPEERNWSTSFVGSTKHFIKVMVEGGEPVYSGEEGKEITRYALAAYVSAQENRDVDLDEITTEAEVEGRIAITTNFCNVGADLCPEE